MRIPTVLFLALLAACAAPTPESDTEKQELSTAVQNTIKRMLATDPGFQKWFDEAAGYVVFPAVGKGGAGIGAAFGRGELHEKGAMVGYVTMKQGSIGFQLGGQKFSEVVFFENEDAVSAFKSGNFEFGAQVSAVAAASGAAMSSKYSGGMAVFILAGKGLMAEAAAGGQKFNFEPK